MTADFQSLLPDSSTVFERAIERTSGERWAEVDADIIRRAKDPWTCPEHLLPFLAFERSVDIWDEAWTIDKKRRVVASAIADHRLKGTEEGISRYIDYAGGELIDVLVPPQGIYAAPGLSQAEWDEWVGRHPRVRITLAHGTKDDLAADEGTFADFSFADWSFTTDDWGPVLHGRRAYLVSGGVATPLQLVQLDLGTATETGVIYERITVPGVGGEAIFADDGFADVHFVDALERAPASHTVRLESTRAHLAGSLIQTVVPVGFEPIDTTFRRESEIWDDPDGVYADWSFADTEFVTADISAQKLADVLHLYDPAVPSPEMIGISFADVSRVGMGHHTSRLLVDAQLADRPGAIFADETSFADVAFAMPEDDSKCDAICDAISAASSLGDQAGMGVSFGILRQRTIQDGLPLDGSYAFGDMIANPL